MRHGRWTRPALLLLTLLFLVGCYQGRPKKKPPIHPNPNMDNTPRYEAQESSAFFEDGTTLRTPVEGTVARGSLHNDPIFYEGIDPRTGKPVEENPVPATMSSLKRGQERFDIYCSVCHGRVGDGKGIVIERGYTPPPTFHSELIRNYPDGHIFDVISNGIRNMPGYADQIPVEDRWDIVNYFRALERSQNADVADVPEELRDRLK
ncbi:cytochrome c [bacterium]|nr:cytochrome c [bacterium]